MAVPANAAVTSYDPPPRSDVIALTRLPACSFVTGGSVGGDAMMDGTLLGWTGTPRFLVDNTHISGNSFFELAPQIPCWTGSSLTVAWSTNQLTGDTPGSGQALASVEFTANCINTVTGERSQVIEGYIGGAYQIGFTRNGGLERSLTSATSITTSSCPRLISLGVKIVRGFSNTPGTVLTPVLGTAVWLPSSWSTASGGWTPSVDGSDIGGEGYELPIICVVDPEGSDIVALIGSAVQEIAEWFPCMFIPVGWDRADKIGHVWSTGNVGELAGAYTDAFPGSIACGVVFTVSTTMGLGTIAVDTCDADFAPSWVKIMVSGMIVLAIAGLAIRRIMWAVGSQA